MLFSSLVWYGFLSQPLLASQTSKDLAAAKPLRINACSLLPKEEVKKHIPWEPMFDQMKIEEEAIGVSGSACGYPSVQIQILPVSHGFIDAMGKGNKLETMGGVGDAAYFRNNANRFAELVVRVGKQLLTLQVTVPADGNIESVKPGLLSLAKALVPKLR